MQTAKITAFVFGLALVTSACGDSMSALNPTAPSSLSPDAVNVEAGANGVAGAMGNGPKPGNGNGNGNGNTNGNGNGNGGGQTPSLTSTPVETRVQFEGAVDAVGDSTITVSGQVVKLTPQTVIRHGDLRYDSSALHAGDRVHVNGRRSESNGVVTVVADEIKLQNDGEGTGTEPPPAAGSLSVVAVDPDAVEGATNTGLFRVTRSGADSLTALPLRVWFALSGNASNGTDYNMPTYVDFAAGAAAADVVVNALTDSAAEGAEAVTLTLTAPASYTLAQAAATVTINDPAAPPAPSVPTVTIAADNNTVNFDTGGVGIFVLKRNGDLSKSLTVTVSVSGSAAGAYGSFLGPLVPFDPGQETASVFFMLDGTTGDVVLTVVDGAAYNPGSPASATITVTP